MNALVKAWTLAAAAALTAGVAVPASALKIVGTVSGTVTAPVIGNQIKIDGVTYPVRPSAEARNALSTLKVGDHVDVMLDAPPTQKGASVTRISASTDR